MGSERNEQLSAMVDGELASDGVQQTLDRMAGNPDEQARWDRYHLMGEVMRRNPMVASATDLSSRISAALDDEPHLLVKPVPQPGHARPWLRAISGMAVAASVAAVAVFAVQQQDELNGTLTAAAPEHAPALRVANDDQVVTSQPVSLNGADIKIQRGDLTPRLVGFPGTSSTGTAVMDNVTAAPANR